ncbi:hypothetical protein Asulf_00436 [Archaeoglobus sulfaticallidus PM70-1]|uniref:DUF22 domain-containing protein n=1 Tax=Archaeoglobus sulfaticallidus PM70-1 TaxID=387631 RepID=N0BBU2_9EURY|nr:DUF22 domain-containing protein [Archaeoglobus sulfaticallidus]AGK60463.1 hypothetical protein Asulf_00436 [Archaeoglobus sulfaticallidus PM70-1]
MEVNIPILTKDGIFREAREFTPFGFKMSEYVRWGFLVADERVKVSKNELFLIKIKPIKLPKNTMISSIGVVRHPVVTVLDVKGDHKDESKGESEIREALVIASDDGVVEKGDLIGTIKIIFIGVGIITRLKAIEVPEAPYRDELFEFTIKTRTDSEIKSFQTIKSTHGYWRSNYGYIEYLISNESKKIKQGEVVEVEIKQVEMPSNTIAVPNGLISNIDGCVIDLIGSFRGIEEDRVLSKVLFIPVADGKISKSELLGTISIYFVATHPVSQPRMKEKRITKGIVKFLDADRIEGDKEKKMKYFPPVFYKRKNTGRWGIIVADERVYVKKGKPVIVKIRDFILPERSIITPMYLMKNDMGTLLGVIQPGIADIHSEKYITHAVFLPLIDGTIEKGDLLGVINVYRIDKLTMEKMLSELGYWKERMEYKFDT